jgi:hypothetical protein
MQLREGGSKKGRLIQGHTNQQVTDFHDIKVLDSRQLRNLPDAVRGSMRVTHYQNVPDMR